MNLSDSKYAQFSIVREMLETPDVVRRFAPASVDPYSGLARSARVLLSGEGSSRIFPAKNAIYGALRGGNPRHLFTEAATQAMEYDLADSAVFVASNSGKTKEGVALIRRLRASGHSATCGIVANAGTPIEQEANLHYLLTCGPERAVAATKSVVEQALFYDILFRTISGRPLPDLSRLAEAMSSAMEAKIPDDIVRRLVDSPTLYWAGRNNGVAEELTLKSNEITHKRSDYLEGTYAVHGVEEVMDSKDSVIIVDPFADEEEKFRTVLAEGVGMSVFAIASRETAFPTIRIDPYEEFLPYIQLAAGWNLLVEIGVNLGRNLDTAERARKVGNELSE